MKVMLLFSIILFGCKSTQEFAGQPCPFIGVGYADEVCSTGIIRKWCVVDWCKFDPKTGRGIWYFDETVSEGQEPVVPKRFEKKVNERYY